MQRRQGAVSPLAEGPANMSELTESFSLLDKAMLDKIRFSFSSRNAESLVSGCRAHVFVSAMKTNPGELASMDWKYVLSGIVIPG